MEVADSSVSIVANCPLAPTAPSLDRFNLSPVETASMSESVKHFCRRLDTLEVQISALHIEEFYPFPVIAVPDNNYLNVVLEATKRAHRALHMTFAIATAGSSPRHITLCFYVPDRVTVLPTTKGDHWS